MYPLVDLTNKRIVVAGASRGIGRETSVLLSKLGAKLVLLARSEEGLKETLVMLEGTEHDCQPFDFSNLDGLDVLSKDIIEKHGSIDGLAYCVGITNDRPIQLIKPEELDKVLRVNLSAFVELVRCFVKKKRFNPGMRVVAVSSVSSLLGKKAHLSYSVSKAGINAAVRCMARELADKQIGVNAVLPGMINTEMYQKYLQNNGGVDSPDNQERLKRQYLGIGEPHDVANLIAFLLSPAAKFITGTCIPIDGGYTSC